MACPYPIKGYRLADGTVRFGAHGGVHRPIEIPCGQCFCCRLERSRQWAIRCVHESQLHDNSVFVTLTYGADCNPVSLEYRDFQLFLKRLRKVKPCRFYMCGEYGEQFQRPHFHALLFGCFFEDRQVLSELPSGSKLYRSALLERLWPHGFSSIGDVTFESAAYVARYCMKKLTGPAAKAHYEAVDGFTGEIVDRVPEFNKMSLKPGIGAGWFAKFGSEVYPNDYVVLRGIKMRPPKYYDGLLERSDVFAREEVAFHRGEVAQRNFDENSPARLLVREAVAKARVSLSKRSI